MFFIPGRDSSTFIATRLIKLTITALIFAALFAMPGCGPSDRAQIESAVENFYSAMADFDLEVLEDLVDGHLAETLDKLEEDALTEASFRAFDRVEWDIDELELNDDKDEADVTIELKLNEIAIEQELELSKKDGAWRITDVDLVVSDEDSGFECVISVDTEGQPESRDLIQQTCAAIEQRLIEAGIPLFVAVSRDGDDGRKSILVRSPVYNSRYDIASLLTVQGHVWFHLLVHDAYDQPIEGISREAVLEWYGSDVPADAKVVPMYENIDLKGLGFGEPIAWYLLEQQPVFDKNVIETAVFYRSEHNMPTLKFSLSEEGAQKMKILTSNNIGKYMAILVDDVCILSAKIMTPMEKEIEIRNISDTLGPTLAIILRSSVIPADTSILEFRKYPPKWIW